MATNIQAPSFIRAALAGARPIELTFGDISDTNILETTSSFYYDPPGSPLRSTQQLNVDWSRFDRHTFFSSAAAKVNVAFDQIINGYPFDGTRAEIEAFFEKLTGFDKWVFDNVPKYRGELHFSGTQVGEDTNGTLGTFITVNDYAGGLFPEISKTKTGENTLDPKGGSLSIEMQAFIPAQANDVQIICQKCTDKNHGFWLALESNVGSTSTVLHFIINSGSNFAEAKVDVEKGRFNHLMCVYDTTYSPHQMFAYANGNVGAPNNNVTGVDLGPLGIESAQLIIGSGSAVGTGAGGGSVVPMQTFSGTLDELRIFHSARTPKQYELYAQKAIYAQPDLRLYYRFNEPPPPLAPGVSTIDNIVLDSSGRSLHALISNFTASLRQDASTDTANPMVYEKLSSAPVLFPAYPPLVALNQRLLTSGSDYDLANPNLITRLVPQHYLLEGQLFDGQDSVEGSLSTEGVSGTGIPGSGQVGSTQLILAFLYVWARFFDEIKLYIDAFGNLHHVDYDQNETVPDNFLLQLLQRQGFAMPPAMFNDASIEQYVDAENIGFDISTGEQPLRYVQNQLLRRILINMPDVIRSKGTLHSVKSFFRAMGIDPDNSVRMREFGGPTSRSLRDAREQKRSVISNITMLETGSLITSPYLSSSRIEPGYPDVSGAPAFDALLTSGSWTYEASVKYTPNQVNTLLSSTQSLGRLCVTGSNASLGGILANVVATDGLISLHARPGAAAAAPYLRLQLPASIYDGNTWHVSFGCQRGDSLGTPLSSSYFLRAAYATAGQITEQVTTSSFFFENEGGGPNALRKLDASLNHSGAYVAIGGGGPQPQTGAAAGFRYLNNTGIVDPSAFAVGFGGAVSGVRFWSKALTVDEWSEHVRNPKSTGVETPLTNWDYVTRESGSFERLRFDTVSRQDITSADANGRITLVDFSGMGLHASGSGFTTSSVVITGDLIDHSYISPYFDEASSNDKIRVRGFLSQDLVDATPWAQVAPVYETPRSEQPNDDTRFVVEFSLVDALNRDIVAIFSTLDSIDNALGAPELVFSPDYPDIARLRDIYFNRLTGRLNFKAFFEFFRWFDAAVGNFVQQLLPRKADFKGTDFVVESHMLERGKVEYLSSDIYLQEGDRTHIDNNLFLQQIAGSLRKW